MNTHDDDDITDSLSDTARETPIHLVKLNILTHRRKKNFSGSC